MPDDHNNWNQKHFGKAQNSFNDAAKGKIKPPVQEVEKKSGESSMINTQPVPVPRPPGMSAQDMARQKHNAALETERKAAAAKNRKPEVSKEDQKEINELNERLRQAAARERKNDRGR
jgi:hypothetical protein